MLNQIIIKNYSWRQRICFSEGEAEPIKQRVKDEDYEKYNYSLYHHKKYKISLIFDLKRCLSNGYLRHDLSIPNALKEFKTKGTISYCYRQVGKKNKFYEKVILVSDDYLENCLNNIDLYMQFNDYDEDFPKELKGNEILNWATPKIRERESVTRWKRGCEFRESVLKRYNYKCAICRCHIPEILEAAHLKEHEVSKGDKRDDKPEYGICLCRNHHKLYDAGLINIDVINLSVSYSDKRLKENFLFKEFEEAYNGILLKTEQLVGGIANEE